MNCMETETVSSDTTITEAATELRKIDAEPQARYQNVPVLEVLKDIVLHPIDQLVRQWNWKSAVLSSILRALIFFFVNLRAGWKAALGAMLAEFLFRSVISGLCGALTESFRHAAPRWAATLTVMALLPFANHTFEFLLHWLRHTPELKASILTSMIFTAVSSAFNLYAMREGALIVGSNSGSLLSDLKRIPQLLIGFIVSMGATIGRALIGSFKRMRIRLESSSIRRIQSTRAT